MTTISRDPDTRLYVIRSTDWTRCEPFYRLADAVAFCRRLGLPYHVAV